MEKKNIYVKENGVYVFKQVDAKDVKTILGYVKKETAAQKKAREKAEASASKEAVEAIEVTEAEKVEDTEHAGE